MRCSYVTVTQGCISWFSWGRLEACHVARLTNSGQVTVSPRAGHTITLTSVGFLLYGGMDGRRNDQGNPAPKLSSAWGSVFLPRFT